MGALGVNTNNLKNNLRVIELEISVRMMHCWGQQEFLKELEMQTRGKQTDCVPWIS